MTEAGASGFFAAGAQGAAEFADAYERYMVPAIFTPWAAVLADATAVGAGDQVTDVACGTGALTRLLVERVGDSGGVVGVDFNPEMLAVARTRATGADLRHGDATALPVGDAEMDVVLCQQGLQFVADQPRAVAEMNRVLRPGGRVGIASWTRLADNPFGRAQFDALVRVGWGDIAPVIHTPFSMTVERLAQLVTDAGFEQVAGRRQQLVSVWPDLARHARGFASGPPLGQRFLSVSPAEQDAFVEAFVAELEPYRSGEGFAVPMTAALVTARRAAA